MIDETKPAPVPRLDTRILRHMLHETIDLLDASSDYTDEACISTDAAMALTRVDWMLMEIFAWLTRELNPDQNAAPSTRLGKPISVLGIDQNALSDELRAYGQAVDRLHQRVFQLDTLVARENPAAGIADVETPPARPRAKVLHIFGDPAPDAKGNDPVGVSRQRLRSALETA
jgi:hypothetical protein